MKPLSTFRDLRVWAELADGTEGHWIFRTVAANGDAIMSGEGGRELRVPVTNLMLIKAEPVVCPECSTEHQIDRPSRRCADCERAWAWAQPKPRELCETCGEPGAVYSPLAKAFRCPQCHAKGGTLTGSSAEARALTESAICRSDDVHSLRHDWTRSKSSYLCRGCKIKTQTRPKGYTA